MLLSLKLYRATGLEERQPDNAAIRHDENLLRKPNSTLAGNHCRCAIAVCRLLMKKERLYNLM